MAQCRKCGANVFKGRSICSGCLAEFTAIRKIAMEHIEKKYGKLSPRNLAICQKEMKRLTNIWRRAPLRFEMEINDEERLRVLAEFCPHCGCIQPKNGICQCWNDD